MRSPLRIVVWWIVAIVLACAFAILIGVSPFNTSKYVRLRDCDDIYGIPYFDVCVCRNGWFGETCEEYEPYSFDDAKEYIVSDTDGELFNTTNELCGDVCENATCCCAIKYDDVMCYGLGAYETLSLPYYELGYENDFNLRLKKRSGKNCWGYACFYDPTYGLVWIDSVVYFKSFSYKWFVATDSITEWDASWQDEMFESIPYEKLPHLGHVLEISISPYLQMWRIAQNNISMESLTVVCIAGEIYKNSNITDHYKLINNGHDLELKLFDFSVEFIEPNPALSYIPYSTQKWDTIIMPNPAFTRKNLPFLFMNVYNLLKTGGHVIVRTTIWTFINDTVLTNGFMGAGMMTQEFFDIFREKFKEVHYSFGNETVSPSFAELEAAPGQETLTWEFNPITDIHPMHTKKWVSFVGKK